jgi:hypothetical protein
MTYRPRATASPQASERHPRGKRIGSSFATVGAIFMRHIRRTVRAGYTMARLGILWLSNKLAAIAKTDGKPTGVLNNAL